RGSFAQRTRAARAEREAAGSRPSVGGAGPQVRGAGRWGPDLGNAYARRRPSAAGAGEEALNQARSAALKHPPGVHQAGRIERILQLAHQLHLQRALVRADLLALELAQAVLGRDGAAEAVDGVVDDAVDRGALAEQRFGTDVVVQVAVADVAE